MAEPIDGAWIQVQHDKTESGAHRVRLEHDGLFGFGIGDTEDQAMWRALQALSGPFFQRSLNAIADGSTPDDRVQSVSREAQPTVHLLSEGRPLCGKPGLVSDWEPDHRWISIHRSAHRPSANCRECLAAVTEREP